MQALTNCQIEAVILDIQINILVIRRRLMQNSISRSTQAVLLAKRGCSIQAVLLNVNTNNLKFEREFIQYSISCSIHAVLLAAKMKSGTAIK